VFEFEKINKYRFASLIKYRQTNDVNYVGKYIQVCVPTPA